VSARVERAPNPRYLPAMPATARDDLVRQTRETLAGVIEDRDATNIKRCLDLLRQLGEEQMTEQDDAAIKLLVDLNCVPTALYRHFDKAGLLLYAGVSMNVTGRTAQHETSSAWFAQVETIKLEWFESRQAALMAEERAIKTEKPLHNVIFNGKANARAQERAPREILPAR